MGKLLSSLQRLAALYLLCVSRSGHILFIGEKKRWSVQLGSASKSKKRTVSFDLSNSVFNSLNFASFPHHSGGYAAARCAVQSVSRDIFGGKLIFS